MASGVRDEPAQGASRRTVAGSAAVAMLRKKFDVLDKELTAANAAVAAQPDNPNVLHQRAELYLARGRKQEALRDYRSAIALDDRANSAGVTSVQWLLAVCRWLAWRTYVVLVVLLGATVVTSGLLAILSDLRGLVPTPLYSAADRGDLAKVTALLRAGQAPGAAAVLGVPLGSQLLGQTPLSVAAKHDYPEVVQALLEAGAEPHGGKAEGPFGWISTETPLYSVRNRPTKATARSVHWTGLLALIPRCLCYVGGPARAHSCCSDAADATRWQTCGSKRRAVRGTFWPASYRITTCGGGSARSHRCSACAPRGGGHSAGSWVVSWPCYWRN